MQGGLKSSSSWLVALIVVLLIHFFAIDSINPYYASIIIYSGINIILAVSLNLVNGFTGQFSMGHAGFMSVGGYIAAYLSLKIGQSNPEIFNQPIAANLIFLLVLIISGLGAALTGYVVGLPSLRLKGDYLAIITLGFGEIIRVIILNVDAIGGARGLTGIPQLSSFAWIYTMVVVTVYFIYRLIHSSYGRGFKAVREDEIAAEAMGLNTTKYKVKAFVIGAFFAGVAGALFAHYLRYLNPQTFDFNRSFEIIIMVVLGGMGSITGSIFAAVFLTVIREVLRSLQDITKIDLRMVIYSLMLIVLMLTRPNGLFGTKELKDFFKNKKKGA